jgi:hypothetical protein
MKEFNVANLRRAENREQKDIVSDRGDLGLDQILSAECKYRTKKLQINTMEEVFKRVPEDSVLHVVFTTELQHTYKLTPNVSDNTALIVFRPSPSYDGNVIEYQVTIMRSEMSKGKKILTHGPTPKDSSVTNGAVFTKVIAFIETRTGILQP